MSKKAGVGTIKGVGEKTEKLFEKIGVYTVDDLIHYYPRGYEIFGEPVPISEVEEGKVCTICGSFGLAKIPESSPSFVPRRSRSFPLCSSQPPVHFC